MEEWLVIVPFCHEQGGRFKGIPDFPKGTVHTAQNENGVLGHGSPLLLGTEPGPLCSLGQLQDGTRGSRRRGTFGGVALC